MTDIVIREITPELVTFSKPFSRFLGWFPMGGRSTAIKLSSGDVWVIASTPFTEETKTAVEKLGTVKYILAADADHHFFLTDWKMNYPEAKMIGVETLAEKKKGESWIFDEIYRPYAENKFGFEADIDAVYFSGFSKKDVAWLHKPSKTLIVADLIFNLPANEQYSMSKQRKTGLLTKKLNPYTEFHRNFIWGETKNKVDMAKDAKAVTAWDFERIIPCHGDVIETEAKRAWRTVYAKFLTMPDPTPPPDTPPAPTPDPAPAAEPHTSEPHTPEPHISESHVSEPHTSEPPAEPRTPDSPVEPRTSDPPVEPRTSDPPVEPRTSDSPVEPRTSDSPVEPHTSESPPEPHTSEAPAESPTDEAPAEPTPAATK